MQKHHQLKETRRRLRPLAIVQIPKEVSKESLLILVILWGEMDVYDQCLGFRSILKAMIRLPRDHCLPYTACRGRESGKWFGVNAFVNGRGSGLDVEVFVLVDMVMKWGDDN